MTIPSERQFHLGGGYLERFAELEIRSAPVIVVADPGGPELDYAKPGFRDAIRRQLNSNTEDLRLAIARVIEDAST